MGPDRESSALDIFVDALEAKSDQEYFRQLVTRTDVPEGLVVVSRPLGSAGPEESLPGGPDYFPGLGGSFHSWYVGPGDEAVFRLGGAERVVASPDR